MVATALSPDSVRLDVGDVWPLTVLVTSDSTGYAVSATVTATVTDPDGVETEPEATTATRGVYQLAPVVDSAGRWVASVDVEGHGVVTFAAEVAGVVTEDGLPDLDDVTDYLGSSAGSWEDDTLITVLAAERAAQLAVCRNPAVYPADLREALLRRVAANLHRRTLGPIPGPQGDAETSPIVPLQDPEVRRLERPWRRLVMG